MIRTKNIKQQQKVFGHSSTPFPGSTHPKALLLIFSQGHITRPCSGWHFLDIAGCPTFLSLLPFLYFLKSFYQSNNTLYNSSNRNLNVISFGAVIHVCFWGEKPAGLGHSCSEEKHIKPETIEAKFHPRNNGNTGHMC